ncbi:MAG TPA: hypothetical protein VFC25_06745 [Verrucomicrobiae bacterium]|nr:hypothetical protein [Verrucomicrobiae bacterium]
MRKNPIRSSFRHLLSLLLALPCAVTLTAASPSIYYKDVCASGCTYSTLQAAIDAITDSSATKVYTVFVDSGILLLDNSTTLNGKSYINIVGNGEGVSIVRGSTTWFANVFATTTSSDFLDLSNSTNVTIRGVTFDARTNDPGTYTSTAFNGVKLQTNDRILFDSAEVRGVNYGVWEAAGTTGNLIEVYNSKFLSTVETMLTRSSTWHIFSSEIKALQTGAESANDSAIALEMINGVNVTIWGCHLHAESSKAGASGSVQALRVGSASSGAELAVIGTQIHLKIGTTNIGSSTRNMFGFFFNAAGTGPSHYDFVGSDIHYESPASMSQGRIGGIGYNPTTASQFISFVGSGIYDIGGSGGTFRSNIIQTTSAGTAPVFRTSGANISSAVAASGSLPSGLASGASTLTNQRGSVTLSGGTASVTLPAAVPDTAYSVAVSTGVNETIRVTGKSTTGFTVTSSNGTSTATVDWILLR